MALTLRVRIEDRNVVKAMKFEPNTAVLDACRMIRERLADTTDISNHKDFGLFFWDEETKKGFWLEPGRTLEYYLLKSEDVIEYRKKLRPLRVRMLDGTVKTMLVDDSQIVSNLMVTICTKIGIINHEEYSLIREKEEEEQENVKPNFGTLTLRRKKASDDRTVDAKMESLKKKLKTDDELGWVDHSKTLREQGVDENETLLLRRKFFFSDQNIDGRDPVQLNLLYVQARDAILNGTHPVTEEKACQFAGIQCQIQFGDFQQEKHKSGFLDLREFVPHYYVKTKGIEKKIYSEHKKYEGKNELDAKVEYVKEARALPTYGVSFFLVKEKLKGRNKLVPRLLGVTKEAVLRLDEKTKEILKEWPLTTVRRWAASPNTFTLDFGDYADQYYSVQTTEGEQISQLIAGYIDIILKKQKSKDWLGVEKDDDAIMLEESVSPNKATIIQQGMTKITKVEEDSISKPGILRTGDTGPNVMGTGHMGGAQHGTMRGQVNLAHAPPMAQQPQITSVGSEPQRALVNTIVVGHEAIDSARRQLDTRMQFPELGTDPASLKWKETTMDTNKQSVSSQLAAMNAATAQVVTLTSGPQEDVDHTAVGAAISTITTNLPSMTRGVQTIAALMDDSMSGDRLIGATRQLCDAFSDLLQAAEPEKQEPRQNLLNAASRVGEASGGVLTNIAEETEINTEVQDVLLGLAKAVANSTAALVLKAKNVASTCETEDQQNRVIGAATQCALTTSQLVAIAKVVAPTIQNPSCQDQLIEAAKEVARAVEAVVQECQLGCQDEALSRELGTAATDVTRALNDLLNHIKHGTKQRVKETTDETCVETIITVTDKMFAQPSDTKEMVNQARILAQATAQLIQSIKEEAYATQQAAGLSPGQAETTPNSDLQTRLLSAAKQLADATARMVAAAKQCASDPRNADQQQRLREAAEDLRTATSLAASDVLRKKLIKRLEDTAKHAASSATQCIAAGQGAGPYNSNHAVQDELISDCRQVANHIPNLVRSIRGTLSEPDSSRAQLDLLQACQSFVQPSTKMVDSVRRALPTVQDESSALQLNNTSKQFSAALADLQASMARAQEACGSLEVDAALDMIRGLDDELEQFRQAADELQLRPLPGDTPELAAHNLSACKKTVGSTMTQLLTAASEGNEDYTGRAARETANALRDFTGAVRSVAATTDDRAAQHSVIDAGHDVMGSSIMLIEEVKIIVTNPRSADSQRKLQNVAKGVSQALNNTVNCLPGQRDVDIVLQEITETTTRLERHQFPPASKPYGELQADLSRAASQLNDVTSDVVHGAKTSPAQLADSTKRFGGAYGDVLDAGMGMAGQAQDEHNRQEIVESLKSVSTVSSRLLNAAKTVSADPSAPNAKNNLTAAARQVTDSINSLVNVCTSAAPGQRECDNAIRQIQSLQPLLANPTEPISDCSYFECLETVMDKSRSLGDGMTGIANHTRQPDPERFGQAVGSVSESICGLIESAAQASYLIGVSDPTSVAGRPGLVDQSQFGRAREAIQQACVALTDRASSQQQVLSAATQIAKHTSALCTSCRVASGKSTNPVAKRHFVQAAKDVANATAALVKEIKELDKDYSDANRARCAQATRPLIEAVDNLCSFANSPEFASVPAKISTKAQQAQQPIGDSGRRIIDGSCALITAAKSLAVNSRDPGRWQALASHSKDVSDSIKALVSSIRDKAPGQKECEDSIEKLSASIRELDQASMAVASQSLAPRRDNTLQGFSDRAENATSQILQTVDKVRAAARGEAERLGHGVTALSSFFEPLCASVVGTCSHMINTKQQMMLIEQSKTLTESALQLLYAAKEGGGNPKASHIHSDIDESADTMKEAAQELLASLEHQAANAGFVDGVIDTINKSMVQQDFTDSRAYGDLSFVDYQTRMVQSVKEISRTSQEMSQKSAADPAQLGQLAANLSHGYSQLASDSRGAVMVANNTEISNRLHSSVQDLGQSCVGLVKAGGSCQAAPADPTAQREVLEANKVVQDKVAQVLSALQAGSRGTQACINAASTVSGIIGDLDTTIMFATAGTLPAENEEDTFSDHRETILKTAKALVEDTKTLVAGAASTQEQLASAAQNAVATILQLADVVKLGAASLGTDNTDAQVMLMNAVRDVASALGDLIHATKSAAGKPSTDPAMLNLKESAKVMVTNVTSLLKTVKVVEDEHNRGTRALEATVEALAQELKAFDSADPPKGKVTPEELIRATKPVTQATARAVAAGNSCRQDDVIAAANAGRKAIADMLTACKGAAYSAESAELKTRTLEAGHSIAAEYRRLLQWVLTILNKPTVESKQQLPAVSRQIAQCVTELVAAAEQLKGSDWVDPDDPCAIAETELLGAASSIDAAAKKLAALRPRRQVKEADQDMNFDELILESCQSIAAATSALVKAASSAQRELVDRGVVSQRAHYSSEDGQWSEGLISAARTVAVATHSLCQAANSLVQGHSSEEMLISAAKQVAGSTAQLLVACKVKADPDSAATRRLQEAGNRVKKATDNLVRAAQQAIEQDEERSLILNKRLVGGLAQELDAQSDVLRKERELEDARLKLAALRRAKYGEGGDSEGEGYLSGYDSSTRYESSRLETSRQDANGARNIYYTSSAHSTPQSTPGNTLKKTSYSVTREFPVNQDPASALAGGLSKLTIERSTASPLADRGAGSEAEMDSSITEGPSFSESLKHFKSFAGGRSGSPASNFNKSSTSHYSSSMTRTTGGGDPLTSLASAERMLSQSSQRVEKTVTMTNTSRSYRSGQT
ncbi:talin-2-like isoform X2 [Amphibalanus amphitrite]|uniref:talin-2-like isoform X2 n=1 Tax=Amphibalanus amphitrite TaxID=1232801 RepID=UPI001C91FC9D|nr:talin-2-like isoform X2 [Amphibalanus amphitrite]